MKRFLSLGSLFSVLAFALVLVVLPGCPGTKTPTPPVAGDKTGGDKTGGDKTGDGGGEKKGKGEALAVKAFDATIKGQVTYDGTPPVMQPIKAIEEHGDKAQCHQGPTTDQTWIVSKGGGVASVAVYLEAPAGKFFALDDKQAKEYKGEPSIDQPFCVYEPYLVGVFAAYKSADGTAHDTGNKVLVKNSGEISHNTKIQGIDRLGNVANLTLGPKAEAKAVPLKYQKDPIEVACDKHGWMKAKIKTFDNPFFAVTDKDGHYEIKNAPSGVEITVKIWHVAGAAKDEHKTLAKGENDLSIKIK